MHLIFSTYFHEVINLKDHEHVQQQSDKQARRTSLAERASQNRLLVKEANISSECGCLFGKTAAKNICQGSLFF